MQNAIERMTNEIVSVMSGGVYGIWLYGSVVLNDFKPGWSDIDLIALTDGPLTDAQAETLLTLRQKLQANAPGNPYYRSFEGIVADVNEYRDRTFTKLVYWGTSGQRITSRCTPDVFSEFELAKYGICVYGDRAWILPAPPYEELVRAVKAQCEAIRTCAVQTDERLYSCGWLLDIARCIYTLRNRDIIGKTQAGMWALSEHLFCDEEPLRTALKIRKDPILYRDRPEVKQWLKALGPVVQAYADVLERELFAITSV